MIQYVEYSPDAVVNAATQTLVNDMALNPYDPHKTHSGKTIDAIMRRLRKEFGAYANHVSIPVH
jgi:hypothetical protein